MSKCQIIAVVLGTINLKPNTLNFENNNSNNTDMQLGAKVCLQCNKENRYKGDKTVKSVLLCWHENIVHAVYLQSKATNTSQ